MLKLYEEVYNYKTNNIILKTIKEKGIQQCSTQICDKENVTGTVLSENGSQRQQMVMDCVGCGRKRAYNEVNSLLSSPQVKSEIDKVINIRALF